MIRWKHNLLRQTVSWQSRECHTKEFICKCSEIPNVFVRNCRNEQRMTFQKEKSSFHEQLSRSSVLDFERVSFHCLLGTEREYITQIGVQHNHYRSGRPILTSWRSGKC